MGLRQFLSNQSNPDDVRMTLGEHLEELRSRLIKAIIGLFVGAIVSYAFIGYIMAFLTYPMTATLKANGYPPVLTTLTPPELFMLELKVALIVGLILSAPYSLVQIWGFIAAGLYPHERRWVRSFMPVSIGLFFVGAIFLLTIVSPLLLNFFLLYRTQYPDISAYMPRFMIPEPSAKPMAPPEAEARWPTSQQIPVLTTAPADPPQGTPWLDNKRGEIQVRFGDTTYIMSRLEKLDQPNRIEPDIRIGEFIPWILQLAAAFGIGFQVPVVVAFLSAIGAASAADMAKLRRYVILGMAMGAAVITPPDPGSMMFLLVPMALLFEAGLLVARRIERRRQQPAGSE